VVKIKPHKNAKGSFLPRLKMKLKLVFFSKPFQTLLTKADKFEDEMRSEDFIQISVRHAIPH